MDTKPQQARWRPRLVPLGFVAQLAALPVYYALDSWTPSWSVDFLLDVLPFLGMALMLGGGVLIAVAGARWAWYARPGVGLATACALILACWAVSALSDAFLNMNIHTWTGSILMPMFSAFCLSIACATLPFVRLLTRRMGG